MAKVIADMTAEELNTEESFHKAQLKEISKRRVKLERIEAANRAKEAAKAAKAKLEAEDEAVREFFRAKGFSKAKIEAMVKASREEKASATPKTRGSRAKSTVKTWTFKGKDGKTYTVKSMGAPSAEVKAYAHKYHKRTSNREIRELAKELAKG